MLAPSERIQQGATVQLASIKVRFDSTGEEMLPVGIPISFQVFLVIIIIIV